MNTGRIVQVVGPVVDIEFSPKTMPAILNAIKIDGTTDDGKSKKFTLLVKLCSISAITLSVLLP